MAEHPTIEAISIAIWEAANDQGDCGGVYVGEMGFPREENGAATTLDGLFDLSAFSKAAAKVLLEHAIGRSNTYQSDMTTPELWLRSYARELGIDLEDE